MRLSGETDDDLTIRNAMRTIAVGEAFIDAAENDLAIWEWLETFLTNSVVDPADREMLQLPALQPPITPVPLRRVK